MTARLVRPRNGRLEVYLPYDNNGGRTNRAWLHEVCGDRASVVYQRPCHRIARNHFRTLVPAMAERFGKVIVEADYSTTATCDERCQNAKGDPEDCVCSCMGQYHGGGVFQRGWTQVGDTALVEHNWVRRQWLVTG